MLDKLVFTVIRLSATNKLVVFTDVLVPLIVKFPVIARSPLTIPPALGKAA